MTNIFQNKQMEIDIHRRKLAFYGPEKYNSSRWSAGKIRRAVKLLADSLEPGRRYRTLDLGCGGMTFEKHLAELPQLDLTFVDMCHEVLRDVSRVRVPGRVYVTGDMERLPFASGSFDLIVHSQSIHHIPDISSAMAEIARILKPGGVLYSIEANGYCPLTIYNHIPSWTRKKFFVSDNQKLFGRSFFESKVAGAGLKVDWSRIVGFDPEGPLGWLEPIMDAIPVVNQVYGGTMLVLSRKP
jgi:SAM-dependent methyltransferase